MPYKVFRLIIGFYWGLASYYFILFALDFGIDSLYPQRSFDDVIGVRQLSAFLIAFTVGYFALIALRVLPAPKNHPTPKKIGPTSKQP
ncbi:hypothetical protein [Kiloniella majae]|uniref:hypothetical protein n=1 Tax=Kiloniella majae TaxID=1938558 RepID=UPI000F78CFF5|nr:hypothetical protein [Kiloniella majae]